MNTLKLKSLAAAAAMVALTGAAQAALVSRPGGMIYDTTQNITWLANLNVNGRMLWNTATAWANNLVHGGFDDWRLPTLNPSDTSCSGNFDPRDGFPLQYYGYNCTGGELSHLFVTDLGNKARESVLNQAGDTPEQIANLALFSNVQSYGYWSGTEYAPAPSSAWDFYSTVGAQHVDGNSLLYAVAVRPGDVAAVIPEPQTYAMMLLGIGALVLARRRRPG